MELGSRYPSNVTHEQVVEDLDKKAKKQENVTQLLARVKRGGPETKDYVLKDGGQLSIIQNGHAVTYHLKLLDGRQVVLEKTEDHMGLLVTDTTGETVRSLGCER